MLFFLWGVFQCRGRGGAVAVCSEGFLQGHVLAGGPASHACRRGSGCTRSLGLRGLIRCAGRPQEWSCGAVPPREWMARGGLVFVFSLGIAPVSVCVLTTGVVIRRRAVSGETARGGFGLGDFFTCSGVDGTPPCGGAGEGLGFLKVARGNVPPCAVASRQRSRNSGGMRRLAAEIPDIFIPLSRNENSGMTMLFFSLRGVPMSGAGRACCRGMCWPGGRPGTHAAAGAAARGVLVWGILSHARERTARGGYFLFGGCSGVGGEFFHTLGSDCTRELGLRGLIRCAGRPQEWSCGAVPPREWMARGGLVFVFSLGGVPVSGAGGRCCCLF